jgi:hypothetical protein
MTFVYRILSQNQNLNVPNMVQNIPMKLHKTMLVHTYKYKTNMIYPQHNPFDKLHQSIKTMYEMLSSQKMKKKKNKKKRDSYNK